LRTLVPLARERRTPGFFDEGVRALEGESGFARALASADLDGTSPDELVRGLCREGARLYLQNPGVRIAYAHALTIPAALRLLLPVVDEPVWRALARAAFHAVAALHAVSSEAAEPAEGVALAEPAPEVARLAGARDETRYRAACSLGEHAIKLAEAALREDALHPDPLLRLAAADAASMLEG